MKEITLSITIAIPKGVKCTKEEVKTWAEYSTGVIDSISIENPLIDYKFEDAKVNNIEVL